MTTSPTSPTNPLSAAPQSPSDGTEPSPAGRREVVTLGAGCFWCVEAVFARIAGVESAVSGYMGGTLANPTYRQVVTGNTGHAEVVQVTFDPAVLPFERLLEIFFVQHDPTTLNRQGADVGTQYRSAIFYHTETQHETAVAVKARLDTSGEFPRPIVTEVTAAGPFYIAEDYHQDYFELNASAPYCRAVIAPKLRKLGLE